MFIFTCVVVLCLHFEAAETRFEYPVLSCPWPLHDDVASPEFHLLPGSEILHTRNRLQVGPLKPTPVLLCGNHHQVKARLQFSSLKADLGLISVCLLPHSHITTHKHCHCVHTCALMCAAPSRFHSACPSNTKQKCLSGKVGAVTVQF